MAQTDTRSHSVSLAYLALWFPKPSETFVLREVQALEAAGARLQIISLYGPLRGGLSRDMASYDHRVRRFGWRAIAVVGWSVLRSMSDRRTRVLLARAVSRRGHGWVRWAENLWAFACGTSLAVALRESRVQHIHAAWASGPATAAFVASRLSGIPFSFAARARDLYLADGLFADKIAAAAFVRCNNRVNLDYVGATFAHEDKVHCVYNGTRFPSRECGGAGFGRPIRLGAVGRLVAKKGYRHLVDACALLVEQGVDFELELIGDGPLAASLRRQVTGLGLSRRVKFRGFVAADNMAAHYADMDIFVMPSVVDIDGDRDGIPNVLMEACLQCVPVVASDVSAIGELIVHRETGTLVPCGDHAAIAAAIVDLVKDPAQAMEMACSAQARVRRQFDPQRNARALLSLFASHAGP